MFPWAPGCGSGGEFYGIVTTPASAAEIPALPFNAVCSFSAEASFSEASFGIIHAGHFMSKQSAIMRHDATGAGWRDSADANISHLKKWSTMELLVLLN